MVSQSNHLIIIIRAMEEIIIDFHAHILPRADHGCKDENVCLEQLKLAKKYGIDVIIATPHFYPNSEDVNSFIEKRDKCFKAYKAVAMEYCKKNGTTLPDVRIGAEVLIWRGLDKMEQLENLCIEETRTILIELPFTRKFDESIVDTLLSIRDKKKLHVVLAHVERYRYSEIMKLVQLGFDVQLNAASLFNLKRKIKCYRYLKYANVVAFGSDIHGISKDYAFFGKAMRKLADRRTLIMNKAAALALKN